MLDCATFESAYAKAMATDANQSRRRIREFIGYSDSDASTDNSAGLRKPITVFGVTYASKKALAAEIGVGESAVRKAEKAGRLESAVMRWMKKGQP